MNSNQSHTCILDAACACLVCVNAVCLGEAGRWLTASVVPFVTRWWQYNTRYVQLLVCAERIRLRLPHLSCHHFPHPPQLPPPPFSLTTGSITFSLYACRFLTPFACLFTTHANVHGHIHTVEWLRKHPQKDPHKCEVILTPIRQLNYELQCV